MDRERTERPKRLTLNEQAARIIEDPRTDGELRRKLQYALDVVTGTRSGTVGLMTEVRDSLIREANRRGR